MPQPKKQPMVFIIRSLEVKPPIRVQNCVISIASEKRKPMSKVFHKLGFLKQVFKAMPSGMVTNPFNMISSLA